MKQRIELPLAGRHALVTGGARGIGAACARALLAHGARVTLAGRDGAALAAMCAELGRSLAASAGAVSHAAPAAVQDQHEAQVHWQVLDVTDAAAVNHGFAAAAARFGRIDILVNNAGQAASAPLLGTDAALWRRMLAVNLDGVFHCSQAALPAMVEAGWGRIVNVASTAGLTGYRYAAAYTAAKHGVVGLTRALALEVATRGVTVNAVCPGYTETAIVQDAVANIAARTGRSAEQARAALVAGNPQQRFVQAEEVANAVAWLCLPASAAMNGQAMAVAGGEVM